MKLKTLIFIDKSTFALAGFQAWATSFRESHDISLPVVLAVMLPSLSMPFP